MRKILNYTLASFLAVSSLLTPIRAEEQPLESSPRIVNSDGTSMQGFTAPDFTFIEPMTDPLGASVAKAEENWREGYPFPSTEGRIKQGILYLDYLKPEEITSKLNTSDYTFSLEGAINQPGYYYLTFETSEDGQNLYVTLRQKDNPIPLEEEVVPLGSVNYTLNRLYRSKVVIKPLGRLRARKTKEFTSPIMISYTQRGETNQFSIKLPSTGVLSETGIYQNLGSPEATSRFNAFIRTANQKDGKATTYYYVIPRGAYNDSWKPTGEEQLVGKYELTGVTRDSIQLPGERSLEGYELVYHQESPGTVIGPPFTPDYLRVQRTDIYEYGRLDSGYTYTIRQFHNEGDTDVSYDVYVYLRDGKLAIAPNKLDIPPLGDKGVDLETGTGWARVARTAPFVKGQTQPAPIDGQWDRYFPGNTNYSAFRIRPNENNTYGRISSIDISGFGSTLAPQSVHPDPENAYYYVRMGRVDVQYQTPDGTILRVNGESTQPVAEREPHGTPYNATNYKVDKLTIDGRIYRLQGHKGDTAAEEGTVERDVDKLVVYVYEDVTQEAVAVFKDGTTNTELVRSNTLVGAPNDRIPTDINIPNKGNTVNEVIAYYETRGYQLDTNAYQDTPTFDDVANNVQEVPIVLVHSELEVDSPKEPNTPIYSVDDSGNYPSGLTESDLTKTVTREIRYWYRAVDDTVASDTITQTVRYKRTAIIDSVTGEFKRYTDWIADGSADFSEVVSPEKEGYNVDKATVTSMTTTAETENTVVDVIYMPKLGSVVVQYKAEDDTEIKANYVDTENKPIGTAYNTDENEEEKPEIIQKEDAVYHLVSVTGEEQGEVAEGTTTVTYTYRKVSYWLADVPEGEPVKTPYPFNRERPDDPIATEVPDRVIIPYVEGYTPQFNGYDLEFVDGNVKGLGYVPPVPQNVGEPTIIYYKKDPITVTKWLIQDTETELKEQQIGSFPDEEGDDIKGYVFVNTVDMIDEYENRTIINYYVEPVTHWRDENGMSLKDSQPGSHPDTEGDDIEHYTFLSTESTKENEKPVVINTYRPKRTYWLDSTGKTLKEPVPGHFPDNDRDDIENYTLDTTRQVAENGEDKVINIYNKNVTYWLSEDGETLKDSVVGIFPDEEGDDIANHTFIETRTIIEDGEYKTVNVYRPIIQEVITKWVDDTGTALKPQEAGEHPDIDGNDIANYDFVETTVDETPERKTITNVYRPHKGSIIVKYIAEDGQEITQDVLVNNEKVGTPYQAQPKEFPGFQYNRLADNSAPENGEVTKGTKEVIYIYTREVDDVPPVIPEPQPEPEPQPGEPDKETGSVHVRYVAESGETLEEVLLVDNQPVGTHYTAEQKDFDQYDFVTVDKPTEGDAVAGDTYITFTYRKQTGSVLVQYLDENNNPISPEERIVDNQPVGTHYATEGKQIPNYTVQEVRGETSGAVIKGETVVAYVYRKNRGMVTVQYVDTEGTVLQTNTITDTVETPYQTEQKELEGYTFVKLADDSAPAEGIIREGNQTVTYIYKATQKVGRVYTTYKLEDGTVVVPRKVVTENKVGTDYVVTPSVPEGYELVKVEGNEKGKITEQDIVVIYTVRKKQPTKPVEPTPAKPSTPTPSNPNVEQPRQLADTGATSTIPYTMAGLALLVASGMIFYTQKKREE